MTMKLTISLAALLVTTALASAQQYCGFDFKTQRGYCGNKAFVAEQVLHEVTDAEMQSLVPTAPDASANAPEAQGPRFYEDFNLGKAAKGGAEIK